jgi:hypothetical protein
LLEPDLDPTFNIFLSDNKVLQLNPESHVWDFSMVWQGTPDIVNSNNLLTKRKNSASHHIPKTNSIIITGGGPSDEVYLMRRYFQDEYTLTKHTAKMNSKRCWH